MGKKDKSDLDSLKEKYPETPFQHSRNISPCPNCGYCPCCGRPIGNFNYPIQPTYPGYPYWGTIC